MWDGRSKTGKTLVPQAGIEVDFVGVYGCELRVVAAIFRALRAPTACKHLDPERLFTLSQLRL